MDIVSRVALVVGPQTTVELTKTMFTVMNYVLPSKGQLSMHCSANVGSDDGVLSYLAFPERERPRCLRTLIVC